MENQQAAGSEKGHPPPPLPSKEESSLPPSGGDYVPYPKIDPRDLEPHHAPQNFSSGTNAAQTPATTMPSNSNPYTTSSPAAPKCELCRFYFLLGFWKLVCFGPSFLFSESETVS